MHIRKTFATITGAALITLAAAFGSSFPADAQGAGCSGYINDPSPCNVEAYTQNAPIGPAYHEAVNLNPGEILVRWEEDYQREYYRIAWVNMAEYNAYTESHPDREWLDVMTFRDVPNEVVGRQHTIPGLPNFSNIGDLTHRTFVVPNLPPGICYAVIVGGVDERFAPADWANRWAYVWTEGFNTGYC